MEQWVLGASLIAGLYLFYKLFELVDRPSKKLKHEFDKILDSDEYKVRGKFEDN